MTPKPSPAERIGPIARRKEWPNCRPRDAATLIIVDDSGKEPLVLMGRRSDKHVFMPGKFVFPGGRISSADSRLRTGDDLNPTVMRKLLVDMKGTESPNRARGIALTALRETFEETGLLIGKPQASAPPTRSPIWRQFHQQGVSPSLAGLRFIARAITPPRRARRYDTRFFCTSREAIAGSIGESDGELLDLHWLTLKDASALDLPPVTQFVLNDLQPYLEAGRLPPRNAPVPYYYARNGFYERRHI